MSRLAAASTYPTPSVPYPVMLDADRFRGISHTTLEAVHAEISALERELESDTCLHVEVGCNNRWLEARSADRTAKRLRINRLREFGRQKFPVAARTALRKATGEGK